MKVLILQDRLRSGGTERQSILLTRELRRAGLDARLVTFRPGGALWPTAADLAPQSLQRGDTGLDWFAPGLRAMVRRIDPDVLVAMGRMANCHLSGAAAALRPGARAVATFRTGKPLPFLFRRSLRRADVIVANSEGARDTLTSRYRLPADKIQVIYNALVFAAPSVPPAAEKAHWTRFLCVAMFRAGKGQARLIRIFAGLPRDAAWELWLAGDGPERRGCEALVGKLGLTGRVQFIGHQADPSRWYTAADAAVHASSTEALSNFLIEAQSYGLPCIAADAQGIPECFVPGRTGWVIPPGDEGAFREAVLRVIAMPPGAREALAGEARAFAHARFDPARQAASYQQLFTSLVGSPA